MSKNRSAMMRALKAIEDHGPKVTNKEIMAVTGIGVNSISSALDNLFVCGMVRKVGSRATRHLFITPEGMNALCPPAPTMRVCLQCRKDFPSQWEGNRICVSCRELASQEDASGLPVQWQGTWV